MQLSPVPESKIFLEKGAKEVQINDELRSVQENYAGDSELWKVRNV